jgi:twinkle protein
MKGTVAAIKNRGLSEKTCRKFGVMVQTDSVGEISRHHYPWYNFNGDLIGAKTRECATKQFHASGSQEGALLFGQQTCSGRGKFITVTEGEIDALSVSEMFDNKYDVVSLRNGASSARKNIQEQLEWLEGYDTVVLCFDNDAAGKKAVDDVKDLFSPSKLKVVTLPKKDANAMLMAGDVRGFVQNWWDAKVYRPDGIVAGSETWDLIVEKRDVRSIMYPWDGLNEITRGHRLGELVTITSGSGMGKSQVIREMEHFWLTSTEEHIGVVALEEDVSRSALGIMSIEANRPLHLEEDTPPEELRPYWEKTLGTGRYFLYDHWGSTGADNLLSRIRYMAKALDCKWIVLDHLSIVVSSQESGDERKAIDEIMTKLRTLVAELNIGLFLVSHLKRSSGQAHEDGGRISLSELRGSQAIAQLSDIVIGLERDQQHEDPLVRNTSLVRVLKNRYSGQTGPAAYLRYDVHTGRLEETAAPLVETNDDF